MASHPLHLRRYLLMDDRKVGAVSRPSDVSMLSGLSPAPEDPGVPPFVDVARKCKCGKQSGKVSVCSDCQKQKYDGFNRTGGKGHKGFLAVVDERRALHLLKSGGYGTGDDPFANFTAVAAASGDPRYLYPILRSIEKLTRCLSLHAQGRVDELGEEFTDISSLMDCAEAMRREDASISRPKPA